MSSARIRDIMSPYVIYCDEDDKIPDIAQKMMENWVDTIFVRDKDGKVIGVITDGIIWKLVAKADKNIYNYKAKDIMYKKIIMVDADRTFNNLEDLKVVIEKSPVKRVAVVSNGNIIGIIRKKFIERVKRYSRHFDVVFS